MPFIDTLLDTSLHRASFDSTALWFESFNRQTRQFDQSIERAILGGRLSKNMGFAFASGYQSAVEALFQGQKVRANDIKIASLCVTEKNGNHPRAIETILTEENGRYFVSGNKAFVSGASDAQLMFIACKTGEDDHGKPQLKMVSVPTDVAGVEIKNLPMLEFIPEVSHGSVCLSHAEVKSSQILEGDGYTNYVKPFRTYEDLHVLAAVTGYRLGEAIDANWGKASIESHLSLILSLQSLAAMDLLSPASHLCLSACRTELTLLLDNTNPLFEKHNPQGYALWLRDRVLLGVASKAHKMRTEKAWLNFL